MTKPHHKCSVCAAKRRLTQGLITRVCRAQVYEEISAIQFEPKLIHALGVLVGKERMIYGL